MSATTTTHSLALARWAPLYAAGPFASRGPSFAGISGGATSGMMAALLPHDTVLTFQNTGRELPRTLDFLDELDAALGRRIVWLEFRKPRVKGAAPKDFEYAVVNYHTADRSGRPFEELLEALWSTMWRHAGTVDFEPRPETLPLLALAAARPAAGIGANE